MKSLELIVERILASVLFAVMPGFLEQLAEKGEGDGQDLIVT